MNWYKKAKMDWNKSYDKLKKQWGRNPTSREVQEHLIPDVTENNNIQDGSDANQNNNGIEEEEVSRKKKRRKQPQPQLQPA